MRALEVREEEWLWSCSDWSFRRDQALEGILDLELSCEFRLRTILQCCTFSYSLSIGNKFWRVSTSSTDKSELQCQARIS